MISCRIHRRDLCAIAVSHSKGVSCSSYENAQFFLDVLKHALRGKIHSAFFGFISSLETVVPVHSVWNSWKESKSSAL